MTHPLLDEVKFSLMGQFMRGSPWAFPALQSLHFIGMALLVGAVAVMDLRVLGIASSLPIQSLRRLVPLALLGFTINVISGALFFAHDPYQYFFNPSFRLKVLLILTAGLNALWFQRGVFSNADWGVPEPASGLAKLAAVVSLLLWVGVIAAGRFIAFTGGT
jgi:hypothetical protein